MAFDEEIFGRALMGATESLAGTLRDRTRRNEEEAMRAREQEKANQVWMQRQNYESKEWGRRFKTEQDALTSRTQRERGFIKAQDITKHRQDIELQDRKDKEWYRRTQLTERNRRAFAQYSTNLDEKSAERKMETEATFNSFFQDKELQDSIQSGLQSQDPLIAAVAQKKMDIINKVRSGEPLGEEDGEFVNSQFSPIAQMGIANAGRANEKRAQELESDKVRMTYYQSLISESDKRLELANAPGAQGLEALTPDQLSKIHQKSVAEYQDYLGSPQYTTTIRNYLKLGGNPDIIDNYLIDTQIPQEEQGELKVALTTKARLEQTIETYGDLLGLTKPEHITQTINENWGELQQQSKHWEIKPREDFEPGEIYPVHNKSTGKWIIAIKTGTGDSRADWTMTDIPWAGKLPGKLDLGDFLSIGITGYPKQGTIADMLTGYGTGGTGVSPRLKEKK